MPRALELRHETRPNSGGAEFAMNRSVGIRALAHEAEDLLELDDLAFHAGDLRHAHQLASTIAQALELQDHMQCRGDLRPHRACRQIEVRHADHLLQPAQGIARRVGVHRRHRPFVAGIHRLQHVERFAAAHLADDDPIRAHAQRVLHQLALTDLAAALDVRRPGLHAGDVDLLQLQLGCVLDRDDAFSSIDVARQSRSAWWSCRIRCRRRSGR